jgi:thymidine phosphorylase
VIDDNVPQPNHSDLRLKRRGIDTYSEFIIYMNRDCDVCRAEGFEVLSRIAVGLNRKRIVATLNVTGNDLHSTHEVGLSEAAWKALTAEKGQNVNLSYPSSLISGSHLRKKVYGGSLSKDELENIVRDVAGGLYDDIHLAAFVTACAGDRIDARETIDLTAAMISAGDRLTWSSSCVADKHCIGGLPGNRTSMIVVPVVAAVGLVIPKTSSRAITSPAGTADVMES